VTVVLSAIFLVALATVVESNESAQKARAEELVVKLGSEEYRVREQASKDILELDFESASEALLAGQKSMDAEVYERCTRLYPILWAKDLDKRLKKFVASPRDVALKNLPLADHWIKIVGDSPESREQYAKIVKEHFDILRSCESNSRASLEAYNEFAKNVYLRKNNVQPRVVGAVSEPIDSEFALFFLLGSAAPANRPLFQSSAYYTQFLNGVHASSRLNPTGDVTMRKLFAAWMENEKHPTILRAALTTASTNSIKETLPTIRKTYQDKTLVPSLRATAMIAYGRLGDKEDAKELETYLTDDTQVTTVAVNGARGAVKLRDIALGSLLVKHGLNTTDYGFLRPMPTNVVSTSYIYYGIENDEKRNKAVEMWNEWKKKNNK
jgi:hypothetical protein